LSSFASRCFSVTTSLFLLFLFFNASDTLLLGAVYYGARIRNHRKRSKAAPTVDFLKRLLSVSQ
jgi:hypothetical protein